MGTKKTWSLKGTKYDWLMERLTQPFEDECFDWPFSGHDRGYGRVRVPGTDNDTRVTHLVLEYFGFPRPEAPNNNALHSCDRPTCIYIGHLEWGPLTKNQQDAVDRGRIVRASGENHAMAKLSDHDVEVMRVIRTLGFNDAEISRMFDISKTHTGRLLNGKTRR